MVRNSVQILGRVDREVPMNDDEDEMGGVPCFLAGDFAVVVGNVQR